MKPFGSGSAAHKQGVDLPFITGWLDDMIRHESEREPIGKLRQARIDKAEAAKVLLEELEE